MSGDITPIRGIASSKPDTQLLASLIQNCTVEGMIDEGNIDFTFKFSLDPAKWASMGDRERETFQHNSYIKLHQNLAYAYEDGVQATHPLDAWQGSGRHMQTAKDNVPLAWCFTATYRIPEGTQPDQLTALVDGMKTRLEAMGKTTLANHSGGIRGYLT